MAKGWNEPTRRTQEISPETALFSGFGTEPGMIGRSDPSTARTSPEVQVEMNLQKAGTGKKIKGEVSSGLPGAWMVGGPSLSLQLVGTGHFECSARRRHIASNTRESCFIFK